MDPVYVEFIKQYGPLGMVIVLLVTGLLVTRKHHEDVVTLQREQIALLQKQLDDMVVQRDAATRDRDTWKTTADRATGAAEVLLEQVTGAGTGRRS